jgi:hypothetical protein
MEDRIWVAVRPQRSGTRVLATEGMGPTLLKACLAPHPWNQRALPSLLEAIALWQKQPVHAVLAVEGQDDAFVTSLCPSLADERLRTPLYALDLVDGRRGPRRARDRIDGMGDFRDLRQLMRFAVAR